MVAWSIGRLIHLKPDSHKSASAQIPRDQELWPVIEQQDSERQGSDIPPGVGIFGSIWKEVLAKAGDRMATHALIALT